MSACVGSRRGACRVSLATCLFVGAAFTAQADEREFWKEGVLTFPRHGRTETSIAWKLAYDLDRSRLGGLEFKPKVKRGVVQWLDTAVTYEFTRVHGPDGSWQTRHGIEFELVPHWRVGQHRARVEFAQRLVASGLFDGTETVYRYLAIPKYIWPAALLPTQQGAEIDLKASYDLSTSVWVDSKFTPLRLIFKTEGGTGWYLSYLLNSSRGSRGEPWDHVHVIVFGLSLASLSP